ncbi:MAG: ABC transporter ATP-binding protein [Flavobacteriales bacterium]|nr:MAG: ABC transporter ATP-binding protein [Flavobacteriales bacterium]
MKVSLSSASKSFGRETVFRDVSHVFEQGSRTAIIGPNGSGKSTLLQCVGGALMLTKGTVKHEISGAVMAQEEVYRHVSIAAPYMSLYEDLSLREAIEIHKRFKPLLGDRSVEAVAEAALLSGQLEKPVRNFSSGMKQRLKLALAILSDTCLLLLDEPTSNLDANGAQWFVGFLNEHVGRRTLVVASNRVDVETALCTGTIDVQQYKG